MSPYEELIEAFKIFGKYEHRQQISTEHDVIYAGPHPTEVTASDMIRLSELDWIPADVCFQRFT